LAIESKVGAKGLDIETKRQILKDIELLKDQESGVKALRWEFSRSPVTGKIGPNASLREFLEKSDIEIIINK
jgi:hypothetical protein